MDNFQKRNIFENVISSQTFGSTVPVKFEIILSRVGGTLGEN
jgi:hypothetical protein